MRALLLAPSLLVLLAAPAAAQMPISGVGRGGGAQWSAIQRWLQGTDRRGRVPRQLATQRDVELSGQIGQLRERIRQLRENGEISRAEARQMRRETARIGISYLSFSSNGISDSEAGELQSRILALNSLAVPRRARESRAGH